MMTLSKCLLDGVSERKNELRNALYELVDIMSRTGCIRIERRTSRYKDLVNQLVDDLFDVFKQELDAAFLEGCAYDCDLESSLDEECVCDFENEDNSLPISTLESPQASSSQQSLDELNIPLVKLVTEDGEEHYGLFYEEVVIEDGEVMHYDGTEEHFSEAQIVCIDSSLSENDRIDTNEDNQQFEKLSVNGLSGMTNSVSIVTTSSSQSQLSPTLQPIEIQHEYDEEDQDNGQMDVENDDRNDNELVVNEECEDGDGQFNGLVNDQLNGDGKNDEVGLEYDDDDDATEVKDMDTDPFSSDNSDPPGDVHHLMESIETNENGISNLNSFGSMHSQQQQQSAQSTREEHEITLQSNEDSSLHSSSSSLSQPSSSIINSTDDVKEVCDEEDVVERPVKRMRSEVFEKGKLELMENEDHVEKNKQNDQVVRVNHEDLSVVNDQMDGEIRDEDSDDGNEQLNGLVNDQLNGDGDNDGVGEVYDDDETEVVEDLNEYDQHGVDQLIGLENESNLEGAETPSQKRPDNMNTSLTTSQLLRASLELLNDQSVPTPSNPNITIPGKSYQNEHQVIQLNKSSNLSSFDCPHNHLLRGSEPQTLQQPQQQQINLDQFNANPDQFNPNSTQTTSSNKTKSKPLPDKPVSAGLDQFTDNLVQSNLCSIQPYTKLNSTLEHPNYTPKPLISKRNSRGKKFRTHKNIILHYSSSVSKEFKFPCEECKKIKNKNYSLAFLMTHLRTYHHINLDQFNANPDQFNPNATQITSSEQTKSNPFPCQPVSSSLDQFSDNFDRSSQSLNLFNAKSKYNLKPPNFSKISSISSTQSNLEDMDEDDQHGDDQLTGLETQSNIENVEAKEVKLAQNRKVDYSTTSTQTLESTMFLQQKQMSSKITSQCNEVQNVQSGQVVVPGKSLTGKWFCEHCGKGFKCQYHLTVHNLTHTGERPFECPKCSQTFNQNSHLQRHLVGQHNKLGKLACTYCDKTFQSPSHLENHVRTHTGQKLFLCTWKDCGKAFSAKDYLKTHRCIHTGERPYKCPWKDCNMTYTHRKQRISHFKVHTDDKPFKCPWEDCHGEFVGIRRFQMHVSQVHTLATPLQSNAFEKLVKRMRSEVAVESGQVSDQNEERNDEANEEYDDDKATEVDEDFDEELLENDQRPELQSNIRTRAIILDEDAESDNVHEDGFLTKIGQGAEKLDEEKNLNRNHLTSVDERSFSCAWIGCNKSFTRNERLQHHSKSNIEELKLKQSRRVQRVQKKPKHVCKECGKEFKFLSRLKVHLQFHSGERPFKCPLESCNLAFADKDICLKHLKYSHTGVRPHVVKKYLNGFFKTEQNLENYLRTLTVERPLHTCTWIECNKSFTRKGALTRHIKSHIKKLDKSRFANSK